MASPHRSSAVVLGVGIKTETTPLHADPSRFLARSTVMMRDRTSDAEYFFGGASVGDEEGSAARTSQFEVVERIFAMPVFHRGTQAFDTFDYFTDERRGSVAPEEVLITSKRAVHPTEHPEVSTMASTNRGAVGLGLGPTLGWAKRHGLFESIERHLRSSVWYGNLSLRQTPEVSRVGGGAGGGVGGAFRLRRYALAHLELPFCLSVVTSVGGDGVFYVGSAVQECFSEAADKADREALMMLDNHLARRDGHANTERSRDRFLDLSGEGAHAAANFFASRVVDGLADVDTRRFTERQVATALLGPEPDAGYTILMRRGGLNLVRVFSPDLTWENKDRAAHPHFAVRDPYC